MCDDIRVDREGFAEVLVHTSGNWTINVNMDYIWREWEMREPNKEEFKGWVEMGKGRKSTRVLDGGKADVRIIAANMRDFGFTVKGEEGEGVGWKVVNSKVRGCGGREGRGART